MKKFFLGLLLGLSFTAALAEAPFWEYILVKAQMPDKTYLGHIGIVKQGIRVVIKDASIILTWDQLATAKAIADEKSRSDFLLVGSPKR